MSINNGAAIGLWLALEQDNPTDASAAQAAALRGYPWLLLGPGKAQPVAIRGAYSTVLSAARALSRLAMSEGSDLWHSDRVAIYFAGGQ